MPNGDVLEVNVNWNQEIQTFTNVLHYRQVGADGTGDVRQALVDAIQSGVQTEWLAAVSEDVTLLGYAARKLYPVQTQQLDVPINAPGTDVADAMTPNIACVIALYAQIEGRKGVGRVYVSGVPEDGISFGNINGPSRATLNALKEQLVLPIVDAGTGFSFQLAVWDGVASIARDVVKGVLRFRVSNLRSRTMSTIG